MVGLAPLDPPYEAPPAPVTQISATGTICRVAESKGWKPRLISRETPMSRLRPTTFAALTFLACPVLVWALAPTPDDGQKPRQIGELTRGHQQHPGRGVERAGTEAGSQDNRSPVRPPGLSRPAGPGRHSRGGPRFHPGRSGRQAHSPGRAAAAPSGLRPQLGQPVVAHPAAPARTGRLLRSAARLAGGAIQAQPQLQGAVPRPC